MLAEVAGHSFRGMKFATVNFRGLVVGVTEEIEVLIKANRKQLI